MLDTCCCFCITLWSSMSVQGYKGDCVERKGNNKLEAPSTLLLLLLWHSCWDCWGFAWSRRWLYPRTSFPRTRNSSSGKHLAVHNSIYFYYFSFFTSCIFIILHKNNTSAQVKPHYVILSDIIAMISYKSLSGHQCKFLIVFIQNEGWFGRVHGNNAD